MSTKNSKSFEKKGKSCPVFTLFVLMWQGISPAPDKYKIVITFVSGDKEMNSSNSKPGSKIILQKDAKDSDGEVIDTSVSVNIGSYTGELDVDIYTVDSEGNLDLIYY